MNVIGAYTDVASWLNANVIDPTSKGALALDASTYSVPVNMSGYPGLSLGAVGTCTCSGASAPVSSYILGGGGGTLILSSVLADMGGSHSSVTIDGNVTFTGANTYSGGTTINGGTLQVGNAGYSGTLGSGNANTVDDGSLVFELPPAP